MSGAPCCPDCSGTLRYDLTELVAMCKDCGFTRTVEEIRELCDADRHPSKLMRPSQERNEA